MRLDAPSECRSGRDGGSSIFDVEKSERAVGRLRETETEPLREWERAWPDFGPLRLFVDAGGALPNLKDSNCTGCR